MAIANLNQTNGVLRSTHFVDGFIRNEWREAKYFAQGAWTQLTGGDIVDFLNGKGDTLDVIFENLLTDNGANIASNTPATKISDANVLGNSQSKDIVRRLYLTKKFGWNSLAQNIGQGDVGAGIQRQVGPWWQREIQSWVFSALRGAVASTISSNNSDFIYETVGASYSAGTTDFDVDGFITARGLLGDQASQLRVIGTHSNVVNRMRIANQIDVIRPSDNSVEVMTFEGYRVIEDDSTPNGANTPVEGTNAAANGMYSSWLFNPDAVRVAISAPRGEPAFELVRDPEAGNDSGATKLITRFNVAIHIPGFSYTGTPAGDFPTKAEVGTAANWTLRAQNHKQIGFRVYNTREHS